MFLFGNDTLLELNDNNYGESVVQNNIICVSNGSRTGLHYVNLSNRGIVFNKESYGYLNQLKIKLSHPSIASATLFYGKKPLSFENKCDLELGDNLINFSSKNEYFVIQSNCDDLIVENIEVSYNKKFEKNSNLELPKVIINTESQKPIVSNSEYINCSVSTSGAEKDINNQSGSIKIRGNSTSTKPKKPYRIKMDKKQSFFGLEKNKNWVLLADWYDASKMHNYSALTFAQMIKDKDEFTVTPIHVSLTINNTDIGIYTFCEHIDEKSGRLNISQSEIWNKNFDDINFYIERDLSTASDSTEIEGTTFFKVQLTDYSPSQYVFALKYPQLEDFNEETDEGVIEHNEEFYQFFEQLKTYITNLCYLFIEYGQDTSCFSQLSTIVDVVSLAKYGCVDQFARELDHGQKSYKMFRRNGGLLEFGPNWDYDLCVYGLPIGPSYVQAPFSTGSTTFKSQNISDPWSRYLFNDAENGFPIYKNIWSSISDGAIDSFLNQQINEIELLSSNIYSDAALWVNDDISSIFDNIVYLYTFISTQIYYLKHEVYQ